VETYAGVSLLDDLPEEVTLLILSFLSARDLGQLGQTSRVRRRRETRLSAVAWMPCVLLGVSHPFLPVPVHVRSTTTG
jgi:hypothetical protein